MLALRRLRTRNAAGLGKQMWCEVWDADDLEPLPLEEPDDLTQKAVISAARERPDRCGVPHGAKIKPELGQIRTGQRAQDHNVRATVLAECLQHSAKLAQTHPGVRMRRNGGVRKAANGHDVIRTPLVSERLRQLQGQLSAATEDPDPNRVQRHGAAHSVAESRGVHSDRLPCPRMKATIS